jgi:threonine aldolase
VNRRGQTLFYRRYNPHNPTGRVVPAAELRELAAIAARHGATGHLGGDPARGGHATVTGDVSSLRASLLIDVLAP